MRHIGKRWGPINISCEKTWDKTGWSCHRPHTNTWCWHTVHGLIRWGLQQPECSHPPSDLHLEADPSKDACHQSRSNATCMAQEPRIMAMSPLEETLITQFLFDVQKDSGHVPCITGESISLPVNTLLDIVQQHKADVFQPGNLLHFAYLLQQPVQWIWIRDTECIPVTGQIFKTVYLVEYHLAILITRLKPDDTIPSQQVHAGLERQQTQVILLAEHPSRTWLRQEVLIVAMLQQIRNPQQPHTCI